MGGGQRWVLQNAWIESEQRNTLWSKAFHCSDGAETGMGKLYQERAAVKSTDHKSIEIRGIEELGGRGARPWLCWDIHGLPMTAKSCCRLRSQTSSASCVGTADTRAAEAGRSIEYTRYKRLHCMAFGASVSRSQMWRPRVCRGLWTNLPST